jgi:hypothetical protein
MNLNINPTLTTTIAADRRDAYVFEAEVTRIRRTRRLARRAARKAGHAAPLAPVTTDAIPASVWSVA